MKTLRSFFLTSALLTASCGPTQAENNLRRCNTELIDTGSGAIDFLAERDRVRVLLGGNLQRRIDDTPTNTHQAIDRLCQDAEGLGLAIDRIAGRTGPRGPFISPCLTIDLPNSSYEAMVHQLKGSTREAIGEISALCSSRSSH